MKLDQEIEVLSRTYELLSRLDDDVKVRVFQWLSSKFRLGQTTLTIYTDAATTVGHNGAVTEESNGQATDTPAPAESTPEGLESFNNFDDMYRYLKPSSDAEKALAAAVFLSSKRNMAEISSAQVQKELKNIGERVSNITQAISALVKKKLMVQLGKDGNSQQARKKYRVTPEAVRTVADFMKKR
jgi:hypothetical protein